MARRNEPTPNNSTNGFIFDVSQKTYTVIDNWLFDSYYCARCLRTYTQNLATCPVCKSNEIINLPELSAQEKIIYAVLKRYAINPDRIFPSHNTISNATSLSLSTVKRGIKGLMKKDLIKVRSNKTVGKSNAYLLFDPFQSVNPSPRAGALKYLEDLTEIAEPGSERPTPSSDRTTPPSSERPTKTTISLKDTTTTAWLCFSCKKELKQTTTQLDLLDSTEHIICPYCASEYIFDLSELPVSKDTILRILEPNDPKKVFTALDVIHFQYEGKDANYQKLLLSFLRKGVVIPDQYIPYPERKLLALKKESLKTEIEQKQAEAKRAKEAEEKKYYDEAKKRYDALPMTKQKVIRADAVKSLPPLLKKHKLAIENAIFKYLMEGEFA